MKMSHITSMFCVLVIALSFMMSSVAYAGDPVDKCINKKLKESGKLFKRMMFCDAKYESESETSQCLDRAERIFSKRWDKIERRAEKRGVDCSEITASKEEVVEHLSTSGLELHDLIDDYLPPEDSSP
jgi:hypothetical protein